MRKSGRCYLNSLYPFSSSRCITIVHFYARCQREPSSFILARVNYIRSCEIRAIFTLHISHILQIWFETNYYPYWASLYVYGQTYECRISSKITFFKKGVFWYATQVWTNGSLSMLCRNEATVKFPFYLWQMLAVNLDSYCNWIKLSHQCLSW